MEAQLAGDPTVARAAFAAAQRRDPRSLPARYFLAEMRSGKVMPSGLRQIVTLARLAPYGASSLAPYLAAYAIDRSTWPQLRIVLRENPELAAATLQSLAKDPANADVILAFADQAAGSTKSVDLGATFEPCECGRIWEGAIGVGRAVPRSPTSQMLIFDPGFSRPDVLTSLQLDADVFDGWTGRETAGWRAARHLLRTGRRRSSKSAPCPVTGRLSAHDACERRSRRRAAVAVETGLRELERGNCRCPLRLGRQERVGDHNRRVVRRSTTAVVRLFV